MTEKPEIILETPESRYLNALKWIRHIAGMHYFGGAFDPEHMRGLANIAADAMMESPSRRTLPDWDEAMAKAQKKASKWAAKMQETFDREMFKDDD